MTFPKHPQVQPIAATDDGLEWFRVHDTPRRHARIAFAENNCCRTWMVRVTGTWMHRFERAHCPVHSLGPLLPLADEHAYITASGAKVTALDLSYRCECWKLDEDEWYDECEQEEQGAFLAWRCELREPPRLWLKLRRGLRQLHPAGRPDYEKHLTGRPEVLWGGHPKRLANRFDKIFIGNVPSHVERDRQLRLREPSFTEAVGRLKRDTEDLRDRFKTTR